MDLNDRKYLLGLKIKTFRKQKSYTQEKFADILGMDISALSKIENGKCYPSLSTIFKMIETLDVSPDELFDFLNVSNSLKLKDDIVIEKVKQLSQKDKQKVLKFLDLIK